MSSEIASKKRLEKHCDWAFDITTQFRASSDEDSESDSDQNPLATTSTGLLSDGLDLSKREESVVYNPNPFSIAKINAAYRRQTTTTAQPILPVRPSEDQKLATTNTGAGGLLIDELDLSKREENVAYNPNPFSIAKINASYRPQAATSVQLIQQTRLSDQKLATTNTGGGGLLIDNLDLSKREGNAAYNPNPFNVAKINTVYRPQATTVNAPTTQSVKLANKPKRAQQRTKPPRTNSNQITIMEGFKTQATKKPRINALPLRVQVPPLLPTTSSHPISPNSNLAVNKPPAGLFPSVSLLSSPSSNPSNYLAKIRTPDDSSSGFVQVKSYPKRDAYQYSPEDLDEEWTTLPSKKKKKRKPKFFSYLLLSYSVC